MSAPVGPVGPNQAAAAPGGLYQAVTVGSTGGVLNNFTITTWSIAVLTLLGMAHMAWSPDPARRFNSQGHSPLLASGVKSGSDRFRVARASATIKDADGTTDLVFLGLALYRDINYYDSGSSQSTTCYFVAFDSLDTVTSVTLKGGLTS